MVGSNLPIQPGGNANNGDEVVFNYDSTRVVSGQKKFGSSQKWANLFWPMMGWAKFGLNHFRPVMGWAKNGPKEFGSS